MMKLTVLFLLFSIFGYVRSQDLVGGIAVSEWSTKCEAYFKQHGANAATMPIYIAGYCEEYICQKYTDKMYGMKINECSKKYMGTKCVPKASNTKLQYPGCCPEYDCQA